MGNLFPACGVDNDKFEISIPKKQKVVNQKSNSQGILKSHSIPKQKNLK